MTAEIIYIIHSENHPQRNNHKTEMCVNLQKHSHFTRLIDTVTDIDRVDLVVSPPDGELRGSTSLRRVPGITRITGRPPTEAVPYVDNVCDL